MVDGIKLVSPIMETDLPMPAEIVWDTLKGNFEIKFNWACGMHIYITPKNRPYTLSKLKIIIKDVIFDSNAILNVMNKQWWLN